MGEPLVISFVILKISHLYGKNNIQRFLIQFTTASGVCISRKNRKKDSMRHPFFMKNYKGCFIKEITSLQSCL
ncbi:hypothetical protein, partial [Hominenteromicrobium sp.]|uniref:hypothetical protein n=1 Tax=Hominenteromicrobium sp. TaxID=3073581 RepID=UPI003A9226AD